MNENTLATIITQIKEEINLDEMGRGKATIRATARLADVDATGLSRSLKASVEISPPKMVQMLIEQGFKTVDILSWNDVGIPDK